MYKNCAASGGRTKKKKKTKKNVQVKDHPGQIKANINKT